MDDAPPPSSMFSMDLRWRVVWSRNILGLTVAQTATNLFVSQSFVYRIMQNFNKHGDVVSPRKRLRLGGRTKITPTLADQLVGLIVELAEQNAIDLVRAPLVSSQTCKRRLGGFVRRGKERRSEFE